MYQKTEKPSRREIDFNNLKRTNDDFQLDNKINVSTIKAISDFSKLQPGKYGKAVFFGESKGADSVRQTSLSAQKYITFMENVGDSIEIVKEKMVFVKKIHYRGTTQSACFYFVIYKKIKNKDIGYINRQPPPNVNQNYHPQQQFIGNQKDMIGNQQNTVY